MGRLTCRHQIWLFAGEVVNGLDLAVMKMKKGEKVLLTIPPEWAFGAEVRPKWCERRFATVIQVLLLEVCQFLAKPSPRTHSWGHIVVRLHTFDFLERLGC